METRRRTVASAYGMSVVSGNTTVAVWSSEPTIDSGAPRTFLTSAVVGVVCVIGVLSCIGWVWNTTNARMAQQRERATLAGSITMVEEEEPCESGEDELTDPPGVAEPPSEHALQTLTTTR